MVESKRIVVVTGGSRGIGRSVCLKFAQEGAKIIFVHYDPDENAANETLGLLSKMGIEAQGEKLDVSSFDAVEPFFTRVLKEHRRVDVLVNNAGITRDTFLMRMSPDQWDSVLNVNLRSVFNCTKAVARPMIKEKSGRIINIASVVAFMGNAGQCNYAASKAGILGFTKSFAREVGSRGITVNAVAPGYINTEMTEALSEAVKESFLSQIPLGTMGEPEDVAEAVYWLASEGARYITGQVIQVNGGLYM